MDTSYFEQFLSNNSSGNLEFENILFLRQLSKRMLFLRHVYMYGTFSFSAWVSSSCYKNNRKKYL